MTTQKKKKALDEFARITFEKFAMDDWKLIYFDANNDKLAGRCYPETHQIYLDNTSVWLYTMDSIRDLFLHEFAHAMFGMAAIQIQHGPIFRKMCKDIGCKGDKTHNKYEINIQAFNKKNLILK